MLYKAVLHLSVVVRPLPEGGLRITLRGNDREDVQERQAEWSRWAEHLPKVGTEDRQDERAGNVTPSERTAELGADEAEGETRDDTDAKNLLQNDKPKEYRAVSEHRFQDTKIIDEDEGATNPIESQHPWAGTTPWERKRRVAPGKLGVGEKWASERPDSDAPQPVPSKDSHSSLHGRAVDRDATEAGSDPQPDKEGGGMSTSVSGDVSYLLERVEAFEDRLDVRLEGLFVKMDGDGDIRVYGELHSRNGAALDQDVEVVVTVYDSSGRVVEVDETLFDSDSFFGFEAFSALLLLEGIRPAKIRVYPKAR
jgi:hypothetical protein